MGSLQLVTRALAAAAVFAAAPAAWAGSDAAVTARSASAAPPPRYSVAPLPATEKPGWSHAPYEAGDCGVCHQREDPKNPGPVKAGGNDLCLVCHEEMQVTRSVRHKHRPAVERCTSCHNPHNSRQRKLLVAGTSTLCFGCHRDVEAVATRSKVKHAALTTDAGCSNCHNPHGANVEKLLVTLPFDLCVKCHSRDGMTDGRGGKLTNFKKWLDSNRVWHAPVESKDCSACHRTHGSDHFRLLMAEYPASFYAPFEAKNYQLCFGCHNAKAVTEPFTTTYTSFRDGSQNLHYLHVNKAERGRTCRACHEVHASKQDHHLREAVPYGKTHWTLKLNYQRTPTGGSCAKTCHDTKTYVNATPGKATVRIAPASTREEPRREHVGP